MRYVVIALGTAAVLVIWLTMQYVDESGQDRARIEPDVTLVAMPQETDSPIEDQEVPPPTVSDEAITDTIEPNAVDDPTFQTAEIEFGPEMRAGIVDYLTGSGLAVVDSERIADSALDGARDCVELAFGNGGKEPTSYAIETCMLNVFANWGLNGIPKTETELAIRLP